MLSGKHDTARIHFRLSRFITKSGQFPLVLRFFLRRDIAHRTSLKVRKNAIVEYLVYQIPLTQLKGPKGNGDMQAAKRD